MPKTTSGASAKRKPAITVRRAEPSDAEAFAYVFTGRKASAFTFQDPYPSVEVWKKRLSEASPNDHILVALMDGKIVGHAGINLIGPGRRKHAASIGMSVHDDYHGMGVGTALMTALIDLADNWRDIVRLELTVFADNKPAIALYKKFGFEVEGTHRKYAFRDGKYEDALFMARLRP